MFDATWSFALMFVSVVAFATTLVVIVVSAFRLRRSPTGYSRPSLVGRGNSGAQKELKSPPSDEEPTVEQAYIEQFVTEDKLTRVSRQRDEYFRIIVSIEQERNQWIEMWREQSSQHLTAQAMLERELTKVRQVAARSVRMLNKMREEYKLEPVNEPAGLVPYEGEPVGTAEGYAERMLVLRDKLGAPINGKLQRDRVDATD